MLADPTGAATELSAGLAACLGALQGVAEFLPISSSGHLSLAQLWLGIDPSSGGHSFNIVVHAGTLLAVLWHYRVDLGALARGVLGLGSESQDEVGAARRMFLALLVGTLPLAAALHPDFKGLIVAGEGSPRFVGVCLLLTAVLLTVSHRLGARAKPENGGATDEPDEAPAPGRALVIGLFQLMAVAPGISRSGSTIAAGLGLGLGRAAAARFSFLLSIPAILGASLDEAMALAQSGAAELSALPYVIGFVTSFAVGLLSLRLLLHVLIRVGLLPFVPYLVLVGVAAIALGGNT